MLRVGLTGGIACGKTTVARMFKRRGARVIFADDVAKQLMRPNAPVYEEVIRRFGKGILQPHGRAIDRARLAEIVFGNPPRIEELNSIVHPAVVAEQDAWMGEIGQADPHAVAIVEAALIYEAGANSHFDKIVVVTCRPEQKAERFAARHQIAMEDARKEVERRSRAQIDDATKAARADFVIDNSGSEPETDAQVDKIWQRFQKLA
jgi:dephospho-CoA kinase